MGHIVTCYQLFLVFDFEIARLRPQLFPIWRLKCLFISSPTNQQKYLPSARYWSRDIMLSPSCWEVVILKSAQTEC